MSAPGARPRSPAGRAAERAESAVDRAVNSAVNRAVNGAVGRAAAGAADRAGRVADRFAEVKPRLRGWLHAGLAPVALAAFVVLIVLSPTAGTRVGSAIYAASALLLFTVSAIYHRGTWSPRTWAFLRRFDHANIFVLIAGSYTPFAILFLHGWAQNALLAIVWGAAVGGMLFRILWTDAPRWLYTPMYIALGWAAIIFIPEWFHGAHRFTAGIAVAVLVLVAVGGLFYTLGGLVYAFKRPDPWPRWFGFHEVFHSCTVVAFVCQYVAASLATYSLR